MGWQKEVLNAEPIIEALVTFAEFLFSKKKKSGKEKKQFVHQTVKQVFDTADKATTGGAKETWDTLEQVLPDMIDKTAETIYPKNKRNKQKKQEKS